jgi:hypothetical protein
MHRKREEGANEPGKAPKDNKKTTKRYGFRPSSSDMLRTQQALL